VRTLPCGYRTRKRGTPNQIGSKFPILEKKTLPPRITGGKRSRVAWGAHGDLKGLPNFRAKVTFRNSKTAEDFSKFYMTNARAEMWNYPEDIEIKGNTVTLWIMSVRDLAGMELYPSYKAESKNVMADLKSAFHEFGDQGKVSILIRKLSAKEKARNKELGDRAGGGKKGKEPNISDGAMLVDLIEKVAKKKKRKNPFAGFERYRGIKKDGKYILPKLVLEFHKPAAARAFLRDVYTEIGPASGWVAPEDFTTSKNRVLITYKNKTQAKIAEKELGRVLNLKHLKSRIVY
jgi:hypothetical protein